MRPELAQKILNQTKTNYDQMAASWNQTRANIWPDWLDFLKYVKAGDKVLDVGCGNGRLVKLFQDVKVDYLGLDQSEALVAIAKKNFPDKNFGLGDILNLPAPDQSFDAVFCLAVLHHLPTPALRQKALQELNRVLKPGGYLILYNWSNWPPMLFLLLKFTLAKILRKSELDYGDVYLDWQRTGLKRYNHIFRKKEIKKLLENNGFILMENRLSKPSFRGFRNLVSVARKGLS